jgi:uncharacterized protein
MTVLNEKKEFIEKLCLGTVQLGLEYGINNLLGKPSREESLFVLDFAKKSGIKLFDTASAYGDAEEIIGEFLTSQKGENKIKIISKLEPNCISEENLTPFGTIEEKLLTSLDKLKLSSIDGYLLHTPSYIFREEVVSALHKLKEKGLIKNIGVSIYEESEALVAAESPLIDYIQIPYSVFDQRLDKTSFFELARKNKKKVFARTAFLQGLIFMQEKNIPEYLSDAKRYFLEFDDIINKHALSRLQASMMFTLSHPGIDYFVFGIDNLKQIKENVEAIQNLQINLNCVNELKNNFSNIESNIIFPSLWKTKENINRN